MMKTYREGEYDTLYFDKLPQRCKEIFFEYLRFGLSHENINKADIFTEVCGFFISEECKSPIEQLFDFAFRIVNFMHEGHNDSPEIELTPQYKIKANGKKYYADFFYDSDYPNTEYGKYKGKNHLKLIIECDGHDFHEKTKEQVAHDNERDFNLKVSGYDILHYSGSQIHNDPLGCAFEVYNYIQLKVGGWEQKELGEEETNGREKNVH